MKTVCQLLCAQLLFCCLLPAALASDLTASGKNDMWENPFLAYAVNPDTQVMTGYMAALRVSPGRTDECKLAFVGNVKNTDAFTIQYLSDVDGFEPGGPTSPAAVKRISNGFLLKIKKDQLGGDCEWILPLIGGPRVKESAAEVAISFQSEISGDWTGVFSIKSRRAPFHTSPDASSVQSTYLIQGDVIYVYDEQPGWYYVRFEGRKKTTSGWIRKSDTVQIKLKKNGGS
jgi:hypothetical protein